MRDLRLTRVPLLLAYLLVLLGTPIGKAGFRWMHLTTAHSTPAMPAAEPERPIAALLVLAPEQVPDTLPAHEHGPAVGHTHPHSVPHEHANPPEHHRQIASAETEPEDRSVAPDQPHEHGGRVHTHQQNPAPDAELPADALSKFYLAPPTTPGPSQSADARHGSQIQPAPHQAAARIDTPPPRLPG